MKAEDIRIGIAGWSYPDWSGIVYSPKDARGPGALASVARLFDCVEINSTFYRYPRSRSVEGWASVAEAHPGFVFSAKVTRDLTHERVVSAAAVHDGAVLLRHGLKPLLEAGKLDCLLAQFPPHFRDGPESRDRIDAIVSELRPLDTAVEVRHTSFLNNSFLEFLERIGAGFVNVDLPPGRDPFPQSAVNTSRVGYVRLHGRNSRAWFDPRAGRDAKYDYYYSSAELEPWVTRIQKLAARTQRLYVIANNHFRGQAPANALEIMKMLDRGAPHIPPGLLALYPRLVEFKV